MSMPRLTCFQTYDVRGRVGTNLDGDIVYRIGRAFAATLGARRVTIARDVRESSPMLVDCLARALLDEGCDVLDLGIAGTEEMYFAVNHHHANGGICVTASHNPKEYNGLKLVGAGAMPLDPAGAFARIRQLAESGEFAGPRADGSRTNVSPESRAAYVQRVMSFSDITRLRPLKILVNAGHGAAGATFDAIAEKLQSAGSPLLFERIYHGPDSTFPQGIPNPLLWHNQQQTAAAVRASGVDFGVAWDGDFDRCFFFDHCGDFVSGEYIVGLLAELFLSREPGAHIVHDTRVIWNTRDIVSARGGTAVPCRTGHAYMKRAMRAHGAVYGGELSSHHYFRDFHFCDSGMIPWLLVAELVSTCGPLRDLIAGRKRAHPSSGEINFVSQNSGAALQRVLDTLAPHHSAVDRTDGLSIDMGDWRMNLRASNTEPLVRLNVEGRAGMNAVEEAVRLLTAILASCGTHPVGDTD